MKRKTSRRSSLFLLELIIAILFFCICAAVCVRFFVKAHTVSQDTKDLDMAVNQAATFAELFRSNDDLLAQLKAQCPDGVLSDNGSAFTLYYDKDWTPCKESSKTFSLAISINEKISLETAEFSVSRVGVTKPVYTLSAEKYHPEESP